MIDEAERLHPGYAFSVMSMQDIANLAGSHTRSIQYTTFDSIILLASFHHLETREERIGLLQGLYDYLSPDGRIYMTNWNLLDQPRYEKSHR
jgi:hypothetical protein